jgi:hypothetical protein
MVQRYINSSERTKALAEGIYLCAVMQDTPAVRVDGSPEQDAYYAWAAKWGIEMDATARQEQFNLFDRVNGRAWG